MPCDLMFAIPVPATEIVQAARGPIEGRGGTLTGDAQSGLFVVPLSLGRIEGRYQTGASLLHLVVTAKPLWVSCAMIQKVMSSLLHQA